MKNVYGDLLPRKDHGIALVCHMCGNIVKIPVHKIPERDGVMICPRCGNGRSIWRDMPSE